MTAYTKIIKENSNYNPRHIEGFIRLQYGTLDHLSREEFKQEIMIAETSIDNAGLKESEELAISFGL